VVLEETMATDYQPSEDEVREYALWLGMDEEEDRELFWIAREGLIHPLPENWQPCRTAEDEIFYFNLVTGESVWDHPCDELFRNKYHEERAALRERRSSTVTTWDDVLTHTRGVGAQAAPAVSETSLVLPPLTRTTVGSDLPEVHDVPSVVGAAAQLWDEWDASHEESSVQEPCVTVTGPREWDDRDDNHEETGVRERSGDGPSQGTFDQEVHRQDRSAASPAHQGMVVHFQSRTAYECHPEFQALRQPAPTGFVLKLRALAATMSA